MAYFGLLFNSIQAPAQPHLQYRHIHTRTFEDIQRRQRTKLKVGQRDILPGVINPIKSST